MISLSALTFIRLVLFYSARDTKIRLSGHNASYAGRVEVFSHGVWGRVMQHPLSPNWKWTQKEATVVCRQLGFPGAITALSYSPFGVGSGPVLMNDVKCTGSEKTIQQCRYRNWVNSRVYSGYEVGVICKTGYSDPSDSDIPIRLQGSSVPNAGRVEVLYQGIWGAIGRRNWDINASTVACRQLGYQAGAEAALTNVVYGPISGPVWLTNLRCSGNENNLMSCSHDGIGFKSQLRSRWYVAGVICKSGSVPNGMSVRLRGSHSANIGRVEVYYAGKWGTICGSGWDINDATVVCRQLGYSTGSLSGYGLFCSAAVQHWFTNFRCYGNESHLDQCAWDFYTDLSYKDCANVVCKDRMADLGFEMRLRGSSVPHAGRVELRINGVWGTIGHESIFNWKRPVDPKIARVICRQLNFTDSVFATTAHVFGWGTGPQWFYSNDLYCLGNETNLLNCSHREPHLTRDLSFDFFGISVVCKPDVPQTNDFPLRLNGSSVPFAGTIEVMYQGVWGGILGGHVDINVGHVVCRQLGYSAAEEIFNGAVFGKVKGPLWIYRIQCSGHETKISDCAVTTWDKATDPLLALYQNPNDAAGVLCNEGNATASKDLKVRLAGAPINNAGQVEVFYAGIWGTVRNSGWDMNAAHVVCRQLGYPGAILIGYSDQFGDGTGPVWFENVRCLGNESNFGECSKDVLGIIYYPSATVLCKLPYQSA
ncbi:scavenger receptor cysteine-rich type 1 protein M130-like [Oculina patagonica]